MRKHGEFYRTILHGPHVTSLYKILLERSFEEQVSWYIEEDHSCINMPDGIREFSMDIQQNYNRVSIYAPGHTAFDLRLNPMPGKQLY